MFRDILVGYEGSERSEDAVALAGLLAGREGVVTAARSSAQSLLELIGERDFDLVVVGSTERGRAGRVLAGTTADKLLHDGPLPVAVAPLGYRGHVPERLRRIGVAFDGSKPSRAALATGHALAAELGAELVVLRVYVTVPILAAGDVGYGALAAEPQQRDAAQAELAAAASGLGVDVTVTAELLDGDPGPVLAARSAGLDLLVVGSKGHGALGRVLLGSVSHHLMCEAASPVLVAPPRSR